MQKEEQKHPIISKNDNTTHSCFWACFCKLKSDNLNQNNYIQINKNLGRVDLIINIEWANWERVNYFLDNKLFISSTHRTYIRAESAIYKSHT